MHLHQIEAEMDYLENQPRSLSICQLYEAMQRELRQCTTDAARDAIAKATGKHVAIS